LGLGVPAAEIQRLVEQALLNARDVHELGSWRGNERFATESMLQRERELLTWVDQSRGDPRHCVQQQTLAKVLDGQPQLRDEQRRAVEHLTRAPLGIAVLEGLPGTGKTNALRAVNDAFVQDNFYVIGASLGGKAARGLEASTGIPSQTIASLLRDFDAGRRQLTPRSILVVDEAGMVDTRIMHDLVGRCRQQGAKLILVGDRAQLQPIGAGAPFANIAERTGAASLTDIRRQREAWQRTAIRDIRNGEGAKALEAYRSRGCLDVAETRADARRRLINAWKIDGAQKPEENLILAPLRTDVEKLNRLAQHERLIMGAIGHRSIGSPEWIVRQYEMLEWNGQCFYVGDRVVCRRTTAAGLNNGDLGTIVQIHPLRQTLTVQFDDRDRPLRIDPVKYRDLQLGYAVSVHQAQGATCENAFALLGGSMQDRELSFVEASRSRGKAHFFTSALEAGENLADLRRQFVKSRAKNLAHDIQAQQEPLVLVHRLES
jgi:ATP-dependent exoDNAse (exonuclease V) alpha subunit